METTRKVIREFLQGALDFLMYWPVVAWEAIVKTFDWGIRFFLTVFLINIVGAGYQWAFKGQEFSAAIPLWFWDVFKIFLLVVFVAVILSYPAMKHRFFDNSLDPFKYTWIRKHNSSNGIGLSIVNFNQGYISRVHGTISQITKDDEPGISFPSTNLILPSTRHGNRAGSSYTDGNVVKPFNKLFIEIAHAKSNGIGVWHCGNESEIAKFPAIEKGSRYIILLRMNTHNFSSNQLTYRDFEIEMVYDHKLRIKRIQRINQ